MTVVRRQRRWWLPLLGLWVLCSATPAAAQAVCVSQNRCLCKGPVELLFDARVESADGQNILFAIDAAQPADANAEWAGSFLEVKDAETPEPGSRWLLFFNRTGSAGPSGVIHRVPIENGEVVCAESDPAFRMPLATATETVFRDDCDQALEEAGYVEPPCVKSGGESGCSVTGSAGGLLFGLAALGVWMRRAGRRRAGPAA